MTYLTEQGVACHALDMRGQGEAEGRRGYAERWSDYQDDLALFLTLAFSIPVAQAPLFLLGQSHGALILARTAIQGGLPQVSGCIFTAPYFQNKVAVPASKILLAKFANQVLPWLPVPTDVPTEWMTNDPAMIAEDRADPLALNIATPRWFVSVQQIQEEVQQNAPGFTLPLLVLYGSEDRIAENAATCAFFAQAGSGDKTVQELNPCRHEPLRETNREATFAQIVHWLQERCHKAMKQIS
jgi:alpha-beta hydrolase superfamily lysophospholipase